MAKAYATAAFIFRRDLRLQDNVGLRKAFELAERVLPCFIFDPRQQPPANDYFSAYGFQFLIESLEDLERQLDDAGGELYRFQGLAHEVVARLIEKHAVEAVCVNRDYTPFSRERDGQIQATCARRHAFFGQYSDLLLNEPGRVMTSAGAPCTVFTPYYRRASQSAIPPPQRLKPGKFWRAKIESARHSGFHAALLKRRSEHLHARGGRQRGLDVLARLDDFKDYERLHDQVGIDGTTSLSAHNKFGTLSIREVYHALCETLGDAGEPIVRQLHWRDFFYQLAFFRPHVFGGSLRRRFDSLEWDDDEALFAAWCEGLTGFPVVDAAMRQLNETGWMHNRARLVVASFLTKDLHIDWRRGERYFANRLIDYDPCVNNGNWQWTASTGADTRPIRIFNPWTQQQRFDPQARYVKRWVPQLRELDARDIHTLFDRRPAGLGDYPYPVVDHKRQFHEARQRYERAR